VEFNGAYKHEACSSLQSRFIETTTVTGKMSWIDPNWPPPGGDGDATIIIYGYTPSFALGVLGCVLFFVAGLAHGWQLFKWRTWWFSTTMVGIVFVRMNFPIAL
jgi:hypothetical protein